MIKNTILPILFFCVTTIHSYGQNSPSISDKFLHYLNHYQADSLSLIITDNFQLRRTFAAYTNNKASFLNDYIPNSKNSNAVYVVLKKTTAKQKTQYLVQDKSDYLKYLNIDYPKWKIMLTTNTQDKITTMMIDTTASYRNYQSQIKQKDSLFEYWLNANYPNENIDVLHATNGLLIRRLKEYATKNSK